MAATIAKATGYDRNRIKETHRLGSDHAEVEAATYNTFVRARVNRDGSGWVTIIQNGNKIHDIRIEPE